LDALTPAGFFSQDFLASKSTESWASLPSRIPFVFVQGMFRRRDANDLLAMLWTWQYADISDNPKHKGDFVAALGAIRARAIVMPSETGLYFRVRDNELAVAQMPQAELRPIPSIWGHVAGAIGANLPHGSFVDAALRELLE
jgi:homoserine O-acetyltransferase